jgi:hypothetical protein
MSGDLTCQLPIDGPGLVEKLEKAGEEVVRHAWCVVRGAGCV